MLDINSFLYIKKLKTNCNLLRLEKKQRFKFLSYFIAGLLKYQSSFYIYLFYLFKSYFFFFSCNVFLYKLHFQGFITKLYYIFKKQTRFFIHDVSNLNFNNLILSNYTKHYTFLFKDLVYGLISNKIVIICNRKHQNIYLTLTN
jgi:hypothetical protein